MVDVTLSSSVRSNLLALQSTTDLIGRTQNRLSTGLRVSSPIDDPVAYFQAKGLSDRASDFTEKKSNIDQGISTLTAATDGIVAVENLVQQLKGLATNAKSSTTSTQINNIVSQFNDLRDQIGNLTSDASYQGLNLVNGTGSTLSVNFSNDTASILNVASVDITTGKNGLDVDKLSAGTATMNFNIAATSAGTLEDTNTIILTVGGSGATLVGTAASFNVQYGTMTLTVDVLTALDTGSVTANKVHLLAGTYAGGDTITITVTTGAAAGGATTGTGFVTITGIDAVTAATVTEQSGVRQAGVGYSTDLSAAITELDSALTSLRSRSQTLGSNVALLQTRLDFTQNYVNTLSDGAGKLTLSDLNEEGANLLALQTRQQLGIQALAFAGQSEQAILGLFR